MDNLSKNLNLLPCLWVVVVVLSGCKPVPSASVTPAATSRSTALPVPGASVRSQALYQQAENACQQHDLPRAIALLRQLNQSATLTPQEHAFCQQQVDRLLANGTPKETAGAATGVSTTSAPGKEAANRVPPAPASSADCGPRALALLCQRLGITTDLATLRKEAGTTAEGTTMEGLATAARRLGLKAEGVQVTRQSLPDLPLPALAWDRQNHFLVVLAIAGSGEQATATLRDPNHPTEETLPCEQLLRRSNGYFLTLQK